MTRRIRLAVFASHPIQYQAPIWRRLAKHPDVDLLVHYFSDFGLRGAIDTDFGVPITWDQPLLEGYPHVFPSRLTAHHFSVYLQKQNFNAALVNGYGYRFEMQLRRLAKPLGMPLIMRPELSSIPDTCRLRRLPRILYRRWFYAGISAFCVIGEQARRSLLASGVPPEKMFASPYAVDSDLFPSHADSLDREGSRRLLGIPAGRFVLLFSGKLIPRKNPLLILRALQRLEARVTLLILGDGPLRGELEREGKRVLREDFLLAGFKNQSELRHYFQAADAFVLPSLYETWGLVVNEAMSFGLPVVISDRVGCAADLVENRYTGFTFRSEDAADLARALRQLIGNDRQLKQFGQNARTVASQYTPDHATRGVVQALEYVCGADRVAGPKRAYLRQ